MGVLIECQADRGMPGQFLSRLRMDSSSSEHADELVPQRVEIENAPVIVHVRNLRCFKVRSKHRYSMPLCRPFSRPMRLGRAIGGIGENEHIPSIPGFATLLKPFPKPLCEGGM